MEEDNINQITEPLIQKGDIVFVEAESGKGATWFCLLLAFEMCKQGSLFGRFDHSNPSKVIYYEGGMQYQELIQRCEQFKADMGESPEIRSSDFIYRSEQTFPSFRDSRFADRCDSEISGYDVVFYDNTTTLFQPAEYGNILSNAEILRRIIGKRQKGITQVFVISESVIHEDFADLILNLSPAKESDTQGLLVNIRKSRHLPPDRQEMFQIGFVTDETGKMKGEYIEFDTDIKTQALIKSLMGKTQKEVGIEIGADQASISRWLKEFEKKGIIKRTGRKTELTKSGQKWIKQHGEVMLNGIRACDNSGLE